MGRASGGVGPSWLAVVVFWACSAAALAEPRRIVLLNVDPELARAASAALEPDVELLPVTGEASRPEELARERAALAVVWQVRDASGGELRVFDAREGRLLGTRRVVGQALNAVTAAALVLSIKTLLPLDGAGERAAADGRAASLGATLAGGATQERSAEAVIAPPAEAGGPQERSAEAARARPGTGEAGESAADALRPAGDSVSGPLLAAVDRRSDGVQRVEGGGRLLASLLELGVHAGVARQERQLGLRYGVAAAIWPARGRVGIGLRADAGPAPELATQSVRARALDAALSAELRVRFRPAADLRVTAAAGPSLHLLRLQGELGAARLGVDRSRLAPGIAASVQLDYLLAPSVCVGLAAAASWLASTQRYFVDDTFVYAPERLRVGLLAALGFLL